MRKHPNKGHEKVEASCADLLLGRWSAEREAGGVGFMPIVDPAAAMPGALVTYGGKGHLLSIAPTGGGKTSGPAITNMRRHPGAAICVDPKGTIFEATADARRALGHMIAVIDMRDGRPSACLEPLGLARRGNADPETCGRVAGEMLVTRGANEREPYWSDGSATAISSLAADLLAGSMLGSCTIGTIHGLFNREDTVHALACEMDNGNISLPMARSAIGSLLSLPDNTTRPCMISSIQQHLRLWDTELVRRITNDTSFDLDMLIAGGPITLYIIVPPVRLAAFAPLLRLWLSGLLNAFSTREQPPEHPTLVLIDEAATLGRFDPLVTAMSLLRSWGVQICTFWQSLGQLDVYGAQARTLVDNAGVIQLLGVRNGRMAREFVDLVGGISEDALLALGPRQQVLAIEGARPIVCDQLRFYDDPLFASALASAGRAS